MQSSNRRILSFIAGGYALILAAVVALGIILSSGMGRLGKITRDLYAHPFAVSNAALEMKGALFELRSLILQLALPGATEIDVRRAERKAAVLDQTAREDLEVIKDYFLGDKAKAWEIGRHLDEWERIRADIFAAAQRGDSEGIQQLIRFRGTPKFTEIAPLVEYVRTFARKRAEHFVNEAEDQSEHRILVAWLLAASLSTFVVVTGFLVSKRVRYLHGATAQSELRYRVLVDNTDTGFVVISEQGKVLEANATYLDLIGRPSPGQVLGHSVLEWTAPEWMDANAQAMKDCLRDGRVTELAMTYVHADGHEVPLSINGAVMAAERGSVLVAYCRDMTMQCALTDRLRQSNRELEEFAFIAAHDLQEPLRKIQAFGDALVADCQDRLDEDGHHYLSRMTAAATRLQQMIDNLLTYSRVTTRAKPFQEVDLERVMREVVTSFDVELHKTGGEVRVDVLPRITADETQMVQLFQNLVGNALKYVEPGKAPRIHVGASEAHGRCRVFVEDNGIGIGQEFHEKIFAMFQRLHSRSEYPGTGIGLAICRKIVERHGGRIGVQSSPGQGSRFTMDLPARGGQVNHRKEKSA